LGCPITSLVRCIQFTVGWFVVWFLLTVYLVPLRFVVLYVALVYVLLGLVRFVFWFVGWFVATRLLGSLFRFGRGSVWFGSFGFGCGSWFGSV